MASAATTLRVVHQQESEIGWNAYPRFPEGQYRGYCAKASNIHWNPIFKRHQIILWFDIFSPTMELLGRVPKWYSLGKKTKPHAGRLSSFFKDWVRANGAAPTRHDRLSLSVFTKRAATITVGDTNSEAPYSVVKTIEAWESAPRKTAEVSALASVADSTHHSTVHPREYSGRILPKGISRGDV